MYGSELIEETARLSGGLESAPRPVQRQDFTLNVALPNLQRLRTRFQSFEADIGHSVLNEPLAPSTGPFSLSSDRLGTQILIALPPESRQSTTLYLVLYQSGPSL